MIFEPISDADVIITDNQKHYFNENVAVKYGIELAIFLHYLKYYSQEKQTPPSWIHMPLSYLCGIFTYWSSKKIKALINKLIKLNLLERKEGELDFYALTPLAHSCYEEGGN